MKIYKDMTDYLCKKGHRVYHWKELAETLHVDGVNILRVTLLVWKNWNKDHRGIAIKKPNLYQNYW